MVADTFADLWTVYIDIILSTNHDPEQKHKGDA